MRLVKAAHGPGRVPAVEVLVSTGLIRDCIVNEDKTTQIRDAIAAGTSQYGMQTFDQSLMHLYSSGLITLEEAVRNASNADEFRMRVQGITSSSEQAREDLKRISNYSSALAPARIENRE
jgi:twitching motility protein PilT